MMSTVFVRVIPQDKDRGYMLLVGFEPSLIQRTAAQYLTLNNVTRASFDRTIASVKSHYQAAIINDVTVPAIAKKIQKMFGEPATIF